MKLFSYKNSSGDTFYLHALRRAKGRIKYVMRKRAAGAISGLPSGYEVCENVQGQVSVRRARAKLLTVSEQDMLSSQLQRLRPLGYRLDITGRTATIYACALDRKCFSESLDAEFANGFADALTKTLSEKYSPDLISLFRAKQRDRNPKRPRFYPLLRVVLEDHDKRRFAVERVCFTGDSGWMRLEVLPLTAAILKYLPHLGKDSFFDLM